MNSTDYMPPRAKLMNRLMKWPVLCGLLGLALVNPAAGADDTYLNQSIINYPVNVPYPPVVDAINFINESVFTVDYTTVTFSEFYQTSDTINYTNKGTMSANTGFNFDTRSSVTGLHSMAGNFVNEQTIACGLDNFTGVTYFSSYYLFYGAGQFKAWATNIINSGTVNVGPAGLMRFTGENVDLRRSKLIVANAGSYATGSGSADVMPFLWYPATSLRRNPIESAYISSAAGLYISPPGAAAGYLRLTNATAFVEETLIPANSYRIVQAAYVQNDSGSNVTYQVFFNPTNRLLGFGTVTIEWRGAYQDSASGAYATNFLYLNNNYTRSVATNVAFNNGIPDNLTVTESPTPMISQAPAVAGFQNVYFDQSFTNRHSYGQIKLVSNQVTTNDVPDRSLTNTPGRIHITATKNLDLGQAEMSGANYVSIQATNQYNGNKGAFIKIPYADLNLGVTNGFLNLTNLMLSQIPNWAGEINAWSTSWLVVDANNVTNDYRVLIVGSQLTPTTIGQVQDLILHSTNTLVVSDLLNVSRTFTSDAQNLILTTNGPGVGAYSFAGELNLGSDSVFWAKSLPNLLNLTNGGAIRTRNLANFGGKLISNNIPTVPAVAATAVLTRASAGVLNLSTNDRIRFGSDAYQYRFVNNLSNSIANQVKIAATFDGTMSNLIAAINEGSGKGTNYSSATVANACVGASPLTNHAFTIAARVAGLAGNTNMIYSLYTTNVVWVTNGVSIAARAFSSLTGGSDAILGLTNRVSFPYDNFVNNGLLADQGSVIYAQNFLNSGAISNGLGSFSLESLNTTMTNGIVVADGEIFIKADTLILSNVVFHAGRALTLTATNLLTDTGVTNGSVWSVGSEGGAYGLNVAVKPPVGDLLGTTITNIAQTNNSTLNVWAGVDYGTSAAGYTNNLAVGRLILNPVAGVINGHNGAFEFKGAGQCPSNALYVDYLELDGYAATNEGAISPYDFSGWLTIHSNLTIYFAQAMQNGQSVAQKIDDASRFQGANGGRLRWVPQYNGYYSSTNFVYPPGVTNVLNKAALAVIDSDGDGKPNAYDDSPFFLSSQVNFTMGLTNLPPMSVRVQWATIPNATNYIYYTTNLTGGNWLPFTNFEKYYCANGQAYTNTALTNCFVSPQPWQAMGSPATNVWVFDVVTNMPHYYRVLVQPALNYPY